MKKIVVVLLFIAVLFTYLIWLSKKDFEDEKQAINAKLSGIGIQIGLDKSQRLIVIAPIEGTPAYKAGLRPSDEIIEINGKSTKGISVMGFIPSLTPSGNR